MLQYDVKVKYPLIAIKFTRAVARVCIRSLNQWNRSISVRLLFRFSLRDSISRSYEKRSNVTIFNIIFSLVFLSSSFKCISKATITRGTGRIFDWLKIRAFINRCSVHTEPPYRDGSRGRVPGVLTPPSEMNCSFLIQLVFCKIWPEICMICILSSSHYVYCLVKSLRLRIRF